MAEVKVNKERSEKPRTEESSSEQNRGESRSKGIARRNEYLPSFFSTGPADLFAMNPFALMRRFSEEADRMFGSWRGGESGRWWPALEISEKEGHLNVCAELPGLKPEDVKVQATAEGLIIQGQRKREHEESREGFHRSERSYGQFYRVVPLPDGADLDKAHAEFKDGELRIEIPLAEPARRHREIPISGGGAGKPGGEGRKS